MSNYLRSYASLAAYLSDKASGTLYSLLTSASYGQSISVISRIGGAGGVQTAVDSVNAICPKESLQIGDVLLYHSAQNRYACAKGGTFSATAVGGNIIDTARFSTGGWTCVGWVIERIGKKCWIASMNDLGSYQMCSDNTTTITGIYTDSGLTDGNGGRRYGWIASGSMERAEEIYGTTRYTYTWPITRTEWVTAVDNAIVNGLTTATITGADNITINTADYNNDFDTYYKQRVLVKFPMPFKSPAASHYGYALADENGDHNTARLLGDPNIDYDTFSAPAASACINYRVTGMVSGWYLPALGQMWRMLRYYHRLVKCGCPITNTWYWSSTQYSSAGAWRVNFNSAYVDYLSRTYTGRVRAVADFQIN